MTGFQAAAVHGSGPQEAAGRHRVLQQIRRVPEIQSQTKLHLRLPAPHAGRQDEVRDHTSQTRHTQLRYTFEQHYKTVIRVIATGITHTNTLSMLS